LHNKHFMNIQQFEFPWRHWIADEFLSPQCLAEVKSIPARNTQANTGRRVGSDRLFITQEHVDTYPHLYKLWLDLHQGDLKKQFEQLTGIDYSNMHPRLEVISDWGDFYLEPHHDHLEKRLTVMIYTDHEKLYPGTELTGHGRIESQDNRAFFFVPAENTMHGYPPTHFDSVRRCLQINYWTYDIPKA
jgi:hypothetical protein